MVNGALNNSPLFGAVIQTHSLTHINVRSVRFLRREVFQWIEYQIYQVKPGSP